MSATPETPPTLNICGEFTIFTAQALKDQLLGMIATAEAEFDIDLSEVTEIDTAGLQLMLMAKREATAIGKSIRFVRHSDPVLDLIDLCALAGQFGDPVLIRPQA